MNIVFRVDASTRIASGHVMRCLTLADKLKSLGHGVSFVCRELSGNYNNFIRERGYDLFALPEPLTPPGGLDWNSHAGWLEVDWRQDADETRTVLDRIGPVDWLVVDHYAIDQRWEKCCRPAAKRIMVFDDLVECRHACDLLLNQNFYADLHEQYAQLVPDDCRILQGVEYALLRPEFASLRETLRQRNGEVSEILVFLGGSDKENVTSKVLAALAQLARIDIAVNVVIGLANPHREQVEALCLQNNFNFHVQTNRLAELMVSADLCVGAGGATTWERYCLGLPTLLVTMAVNQEEGARFQAEQGLVKLLGDGNALDINDIALEIRSALAVPKDLQAMSQKMIQVVDGKGTDRVVAMMTDTGCS